MSTNFQKNMSDHTRKVSLGLRTEPKQNPRFAAAAHTSTLPPKTASKSRIRKTQKKSRTKARTDTPAVEAPTLNEREPQEEYEEEEEMPFDLDILGPENAPLTGYQFDEQMHDCPVNQEQLHSLPFENELSACPIPGCEVALQKFEVCLARGCRYRNMCEMCVFGEMLNRDELARHERELDAADSLMLMRSGVIGLASVQCMDLDLDDERYSSEDTIYAPYEDGI